MEAKPLQRSWHWCPSRCCDQLQCLQGWLSLTSLSQRLPRQCCQCQCQCRFPQHCREKMAGVLRATPMGVGSSAQCCRAPAEAHVGVRKRGERPRRLPGKTSGSSMTGLHGQGGRAPPKETECSMAASKELPQSPISMSKEANVCCAGGPRN